MCPLIWCDMVGLGVICIVHWPAVSSIRGDFFNVLGVKWLNVDLGIVEIVVGMRHRIDRLV